MPYYAKQTWVDFPSTATPINADRLNHIEDGIAAASLVMNGDVTPVTTVATSGNYGLYVAQPSTTIVTTTGNLIINDLDPGQSGLAYTATVEVVIGATGHTVSFPTNLLWVEGLIPTVPSTTNARHLYHFLWDGTRWLGIVGGTNFA